MKWVNKNAFLEGSLPMIHTTALCRFRILICTLIFSLGAVLALAQTGPAQSVPNVIHTMPPAIVIGFVGGFIKHDNLVHSEVQLAARLRKAYPTGVDVETFESYHGKEAREKILRLLDVNHDGILTSAEKKNGRIIIYGHSWGGSEAIALARKLEKDGIPVLLTIQVDSIAKIHQNDAVIPANVAQAANFYQLHGLLHGQSDIRAADPARTSIIGNFRFDYKASPYKCDQYPWYDRIFGKSHTQIECDPRVWERAESLVRSNLPPPRGNGTVAR
jgi:pimeloyl-ACP methyl ester carboxylesterase